VVYVGSYDNNVYALNTKNGIQLWKYTTNGHVASSPAVVAGAVYIGSFDGEVYALAGSPPSVTSSDALFVVLGVIVLVVVITTAVLLMLRKKLKTEPTSTKFQSFSEDIKCDLSLILAC